VVAVLAAAVLGLAYLAFFRPGHVAQAARSQHPASSRSPRVTTATARASATPSATPTTSATPTAVAAQFPALAGVGCPQGAGTSAVTGARSPGGDGWISVRGGLPACGGQALATRKTGTTGLVQDTFTWTFRVGHPATCTARIFVANTNPSSGNAHYAVYGESRAAGASIGQFEIDQGAAKGQWVQEGTWPVRGTLRIQLTDAPAYPGDFYHVTASAARANCS